MPSFPIIDSHVHLYDPSQIAYPWMVDVALLNRPYGLDQFAALTAEVQLEGLVFVEVDAAPGRHLDEARWVEAHAAGNSILRGMVAAMPLEKGPAVAADLDAYAQLPHARGIRRLIERHTTEPGWSLQTSFIEGLRLLPSYGFTFDLCLHHHQLGEVIDLVRRCSDVQFVVDHIAKPDIRGGLDKPWRRQMQEIAQAPNVSCKISGVVTEADHAAWTYDQVQPYIAHAIDCFGFDRVMFGGDWPVSELATSYARWVETVDKVIQGVPDVDVRKLYRDNAIAFYRL